MPETSIIGVGGFLTRAYDMSSDRSEMTDLAGAAFRGASSNPYGRSCPIGIGKSEKVVEWLDVVSDWLFPDDASVVFVFVFSFLTYALRPDILSFGEYYMRLVP